MVALLLLLVVRLLLLRLLVGMEVVALLLRVWRKVDTVGRGMLIRRWRQRLLLLRLLMMVVVLVGRQRERWSSRETRRLLLVLMRLQLGLRRQAVVAASRSCVGSHKVASATALPGP